MSPAALPTNPLAHTASGYLGSCETHTQGGVRLVMHLRGVFGARARACTVRAREDGLHFDGVHARMRHSIRASSAQYGGLPGR